MAPNFFFGGGGGARGATAAVTRWNCYAHFLKSLIGKRLQQEHTVLSQVFPVQQDILLPETEAGGTVLCACFYEDHAGLDWEWLQQEQELLPDLVFSDNPNMDKSTDSCCRSFLGWLWRRP